MPGTARHVPGIMIRVRDVTTALQILSMQGRLHAEESNVTFVIIRLFSYTDIVHWYINIYIYHYVHLYHGMCVCFVRMYVGQLLY